MKVFNRDTQKYQTINIRDIEVTTDAFIENGVLYYDGMNGISPTLIHWSGNHSKGYDSQMFRWMAHKEGRICATCLKAFNRENKHMPIYV